MMKKLVRVKPVLRSAKKPASSFPIKRAPPTVVHLGNVGLNLPGEEICAKTKKFSKMFKGINFIGIDKKKAFSTQKNWKQIKGDALFGLKSIKDNSVSIIRSEMTLGYYTSAINPAYEKEAGQPSFNYAKRVMDVALKKLKPNGKLVIIADKNVVDNLVALKNICGFKQVFVSSIKSEKATSYWAEKFAIVDEKYKSNPIMSVTFIK